MLMVHKLIDAIRGADKSAQVDFFPRVTMDHANSVIDRLHRAEKFDFGEIILELQDDNYRYAIPQLTEVEIEAWQQSLLPLPAPLCWYEFVLNKCRSGLLVEEKYDLWLFSRLDWLGNHPIFFDGGIQVGIGKTTGTKTLVIDYDPSGIIYNWATENYKASFPKKGNFVFDEIEDTKFKTITSNIGKELGASYLSIPAMGLYLTLMLNSHSTEKTRNTAPIALNKSRIKSHKTPLFDHRVIKIVPERYIRQSRLEAGYTRMSPRLHWRRSHIRTLYRESNHEKKVLIPRCLVGDAKLGQISHEYKYEGGKK